VRILGVDPGLTRCGVGVIDARPDRTLSLVEVLVVQSAPSMPLPERLLALRGEFARLMEQHQPDRVAIEQVFAQQNLSSVMGVAQASAIAMVEAASRGIPVDMHTPSEVKAAVTGSGRANKAQVAAMVRRLLPIGDEKFLPDATDALALAICNAWRGRADAIASSATTLTPAQQRWREAESRARQRRATN
jgi:crossover junction endodeoxyribonuclease RuvC